MILAKLGCSKVGIPQHHWDYFIGLCLTKFHQSKYSLIVLNTEVGIFGSAENNSCSQ